MDGMMSVVEGGLGGGLLKHDDVSLEEGGLVR